LIDNGVKFIFGYTGGAIMPIFDEMEKQKSLSFIMSRHEQGAAFMAQGISRASLSTSHPRTGVCMATSGPGAMNLVTGIADANMDSVPVLAITGQVPTGVIATDAFQESDVVGVMMPLTKQTYMPLSVNDIEETIQINLGGAASGWTVEDALAEALPDYFFVAGDPGDDVDLAAVAAASPVSPADVCFRLADGATMPAHAAVIAARCPALLGRAGGAGDGDGGGVRVVRLGAGVTAAALRVVMRWMYSGQDVPATVDVPVTSPLEEEAPAEEGEVGRPRPVFVNYPASVARYVGINCRGKRGSARAPGPAFNRARPSPGLK
jgi:hypothetical protein